MWQRLAQQRHQVALACKVLSLIGRGGRLGCADSLPWLLLLLLLLFMPFAVIKEQHLLAPCLTALLLLQLVILLYVVLVLCLRTE